MKKICIIIILFVAILFGACSNEKNEIKVAAIISLSGSGSGTGIPISHGIEFAINELNNKGGIDGKKIKLIIKDNKTNKEEALKIFDEIEKTESPILYITNMSFISVALKEKAEKYKVPLLALASSSQKVTKDVKWTFRNYASSLEDNEIVIKNIKESGIKEIDIIYLNDEYGQEMKDLAIVGLKSTNIKVNSILFDNNNNDFKQLSENTKDSKGIYFVGYPTHVTNILDNLAKINYKGFIFGTTGMASYEAINSKIEPLFITAPRVYDDNFIYAAKVRERYKAEYNENLDFFSANGYDAIKLSMGLLYNEKNIDRVNLRRKLESGFIHSGVFGIINVKSGSHDIFIPLEKAKIENKKIIFKGAKK